MPKFELTTTEREQDWSKDNEPLQCFAVTQSTVDTPGVQEGVTESAGVHTQSQDDTPGYGRQAGPLSPLAD